MLTFIKQTILYCGISILLAGCGGGGGSSTNVSTITPTETGGGVDTEYHNDRYVALGKLLLRDNYKIGGGLKETNALFGLDPDYTPESYFSGSPCYDKCWHTGIDYRAQSALDLYSPVDGVVVSSGATTSGELTIKDDKTGLYVTFLHMSSRKVGIDDKVQVGCSIGRTGNTSPIALPYHLHIEMKNAKPVLNWSYSKNSLIDAGALNPLRIIDDYSFNATKLSTGNGLPATSTCANARVGGSPGGGTTTPPPATGGGTNTGGGTTLPPPSTGGGNITPTPSCIGSSGQTFYSGQVETIVNQCGSGYQGSITIRRTCQPSSAEGWYTETTNACTPIPPSITNIQAYNYNSGLNKIFGGFFRYNNAVVKVSGSYLPDTSVIEVNGLTCNIVASNTISAFSNQVGGISISAIGTQQYVYPATSGISNGFVSVCDGGYVAGNTTYTVRVKSKAGTSDYIGSGVNVFSAQ